MKRGIQMESFLLDLMGDNFTVIMTRLLIILVLSGLIGFEREWNNHSAGFRTHILVGVGACLMMLLSLYGFQHLIDVYDNVRFDPARIPSYVISGIGFLGAGTIIVYGGTIRGLTTAASIWAVAGIGLVVGAGMYGPAILVTLIILFSLILLNRIENLFPSERKFVKLEIIAKKGLEIHDLVKVIENQNLDISNVEIEKMGSDLRKVFIKVNSIGGKEKLILFEAISKLDYISHVAELRL